jgi:hypothetical protein
MNFLRSVGINNAYVKYKLPLSNLCLIRWSPKAKTEMHDHDGKKCDYMVINGTLHECRYLCKEKESHYTWQTINPFLINSITDEEGNHQIFNFENKVKWSLHRYV